MSTVLPGRLARFLDPSFVIRRGKGSGVDGDIVDVCALQAADWLAGGDGRNDHSENVCPVIGEFLRNINDSCLFVFHRNELKTLVPKILGTRASYAVMAKRANICAEYAAKSAKFATESAESIKSVKSAAEYAAEHAATSARYAAKSANFAAEYAAGFAAESIDCAAESVNYGTKSTAELRKICIECIESMIAITD